MNSSAIYTVIDKGKESYFLSSIAGGYSYPFYIFNYADRMARVINENYPMGEVSVSEIFPLMKANHNFPESVHGEHLFRTVPDHTAVQRINEMKSSDDTAFCITLDYDERKIGFVFNKNCPEITLEDIEIDTLSNSVTSVFEHTDHHVDTRLSESENEELFYKNALGKAAEIVRSLKETVMEISLVNNRYTLRLQLPAGDEDIKRAERLLETYSLDSCEVSRIDIKNSDLEFINKCSELKFYALNWLSKWTNSMLVQGDAHQVDKLAAIAEAHCFEHIDEAMDAARNINYYDCVPANNEEEYAHYVLYESNREDIQKNFAREVEDYIDYYHFGKDMADVDNVHFTSRGCVIDSRDIAQDEAMNMSL